MHYEQSNYLPFVQKKGHLPLKCWGFCFIPPRIRVNIHYVYTTNLLYKFFLNLNTYKLFDNQPYTYRDLNGDLNNEFVRTR